MSRRFLNIIMFASLAVPLTSCLQEKFFHDPSDPRLPKFSEEGNQVAGSIVSGEAWKTFYSPGFMGPNRGLFFVNHQKGDSISIHFEGNFRKDSTLGRTGRNFIVILKNTSLNKLEDIYALKDKFIALDGENNYVLYEDRWATTPGGQIREPVRGTGGVSLTVAKEHITKSKSKRANGETYYPIIVAGTFDFVFTASGVHAESGRFDFELVDLYLDQEP
jgi:hypothetical protein